MQKYNQVLFGNSVNWYLVEAVSTLIITHQFNSTKSKQN